MTFQQLVGARVIETLVPLTASAVIGGEVTNRVEMKRVGRPKPKRTKPTTPGRSKIRFKNDPATRAMDTTVVCISMPIGELVALDAICERVQMPRSHFIRQAVKHFAVKVLPPEGKP